MSLDSYTNLKTELADWSHRSDLTSYLDTFIDLTEQMFKHEPRSPDDPDIGGVRVTITRATGTLSTSNAYISKPSDYISAYSFDLTGTDGGQLVYKSPDLLPALFREGSGKPRYWTIGDVISFDILPDSAYAYELAYWNSVPAFGS